METVRFSRKEKLGFIVCMIISLSCAYNVISMALAGPAPPPANTIQQGVGVNLPTAEFWDYFYRGHNLTAFFEGLAAILASLPVGDMVDVLNETNVEWGVVFGTTGDWYTHTLPGEPKVILLEMHPDNLDYDGVLVIPKPYDKTATQWQLALYWINGTQITDNTNFKVMYHLRYNPDDPTSNAVQMPVGWEP